MRVETASWRREKPAGSLPPLVSGDLLSVLRPVSPRLVQRRCGNCLAGQLGSIELLGATDHRSEAEGGPIEVLGSRTI